MSQQTRIQTKIREYRARTLTSRAKHIAEGVQYAIGTLFFLIMVIYAGVRGYKLKTQLPATYQTTSTPSQLEFEELNQIFGHNIPPSTFEFPAMTICVQKPISISVDSCVNVMFPLGSAAKCDPIGIYSRSFMVGTKNCNCVTVNDSPGRQMIAKSGNDVFKIFVSTTDNHTDTVLYVMAHHHLGPDIDPAPSVNSFFSVGFGSVTEIVGKKIYDVDAIGGSQYSYDIRTSNYQLSDGKANQFGLAFRYPMLQITYQKDFLPLDYNSWLGEVGGVACLLFFLQRLVVSLLVALFKRFDGTSHGGQGHTNEETQGFAHL
ncbi:hypothetical protein BC833DRAFT_656737 [Globomyces pollinis-pini]|nr:hypothetical protein BC833DRAFT_656737 [Globomyces pollinis-pini]